MITGLLVTACTPLKLHNKAAVAKNMPKTSSILEIVVDVLNNQFSELLQSLHQRLSSQKLAVTILK